MNNNSDPAAFWMMLQTVILGITAYWAWRYTRETIALRRSAARQAYIMRQQRQIAQETLEQLLDERKRASRPFFLFENVGAMQTGNEKIRFGIINKGAAVHGVRIGPSTPIEYFGMVSTTRANTYWDTGQRFEIELVLADFSEGKQVVIEIDSTTLLGERLRNCFRLDRKGITDISSSAVNAETQRFPGSPRTSILDFSA